MEMFDITRLGSSIEHARSSNRVEQEIFVRRIESSRSHCSIENFEFESSRFTCSIDVRLEMFEMLEKKVIYIDLYVRIGDIKGY